MRDTNIAGRAILALTIALPLACSAAPVFAQGNCMTFGEARKAGLFSGIKPRPASTVKQEVETSTGGRVVSFQVCRPGPVYKLTVLRPDNSVVTRTVPAQ